MLFSLLTFGDNTLSCSLLVLELEVNVGLWRGVLGSKQVELWVIFQGFVFHCGFPPLPPLTPNEATHGPRSVRLMASVEVRIYSGCWYNIYLACRDLKKLEFGQTAVLYVFEAIVLFIFQILSIRAKSCRNDFM